MSALRKVLVVDDDPVAGKRFRRALSRKKGYVVMAARNAAEALEKMREQEYDIVFIDTTGTDCIELTERVKARWPGTQVVIMTGDDSTVYEDRAMAVGVSSIMCKPLSPEMIEGSAVYAIQQITLSREENWQDMDEEDEIDEVFEKQGRFKNLAFVLAAPFIDLACAIVFAFIGLFVLALMSGQVMLQSPVIRGFSRRTKVIALLLAAPFIGLFSVVMLPVLGFFMLAEAGGRVIDTIPVAQKALGYVKNISLFLAAPFIGLVYAIVLPVVGISVLIKAVRQTLTTKNTKT